MVRLSGSPRSNRNAKRLISVSTMAGIILVCALLGQLPTTTPSQLAPTSSPAVVPMGGNPYWNMVGTMVLYRNGSKAGNQPYWVAQSFQVTKPAPASVIVGLIVYVWLARDVPLNQSIPETADNITVLLVNITNGTPDIPNPISNQTVSPANISAVGPYPRGVMQTNSSLAIRLSFSPPSPLGFAEGEYAVFLYRNNLGDNDDYHIGYAYYWAASKLDIYYGGGSWSLDTNGTWRYYPIDMCFALAEITFP
jgi:hypothetical protein